MSAPSTGLTRLTISSPQRRADVAVPAAVPLAEILPDLLEHAGVGLADAGERHGGWVLRRADGSALSPDASLSAHGVPDGAVLHLVPAYTDWPEPDYDDIADAVAADARRTGGRWTGAAARAAGLASAGVALGAGLWILLQSGPHWTVPALAAFAVAAGLLVAGLLASRGYGDGPTGAVLAGYAMPYAFLAGLLLFAGSGPGTGASPSSGAGPATGLPLGLGLAAPAGLRPWHLLDASVALLLAAAAGAIGTGYRLRLFVGGAVAGLAGTLGALIGLRTGAPGAAAVVLTLLGTGSGAVPVLAVRLGGLSLPVPVEAAPDPTGRSWTGGALRPPAGHPPAGQQLTGGPPPAQQLTVGGRRPIVAAVERTDEMLLGMLLGLAAAAVVASAVLVRSGGAAGRVLVVVVALALLLRSRLFVTVRHRVPLLTAGVAGLAGLALAVGLGRPAAVSMLVVGLLALVGLLVTVAGAYHARRPASPYLGRIADLVETGCVVSIVPLACAVLGLYARAAALFG